MRSGGGFEGRQGRGALGELLLADDVAAPPGPSGGPVSAETSQAVGDSEAQLPYSLLGAGEAEMPMGWVAIEVLVGKAAGPFAADNRWAASFWLNTPSSPVIDRCGVAHSHLGNPAHRANPFRNKECVHFWGNWAGVIPTFILTFTFPAFAQLPKCLILSCLGRLVARMGIEPIPQP